LDDPETFAVFNLADRHNWLVCQVLDMTLAEYEAWWEYHRKRGDCKKGD